MGIDVEIIIVIVTLSLVQSVFGMGLLIFGTPTLLLLGYSFTDTLIWLLPASIGISVLQLLSAYKSRLQILPPRRALICLIPMAITLAFILTTDTKVKVDLLVGAAMIVAASVRLSANLRSALSLAVNRFESPFLALMGVLHGSTNMGGSLLSVYATSLETEKNDIRHIIAQYYCVFASAQLITLAIFSIDKFHLGCIFSFTISSLLYILFGNKIFNISSDRLYSRLFTAFMIAYGVAIFVKSML